jgi:hypothetical protein
MSNPKQNPAPQLPQAEREAIIDLLHLGLYADAHIGMKETQFVADVVETIGWDDNLSFSNYQPLSIAAARKARADEVNKVKFIESAASRLKSKAAKELALSLCADLFGADGTHAREATLLAQIRAILK